MRQQRARRVGILIQQSLPEIIARRTLFELACDGIPVTVLRVDMSPDLKIATAYVSGLGRDDDHVIDSLNRHRRFLRGELGRHLDLRFTPELRFRCDDGLRHSTTITALLHSPRVSRDLKNDDDPDIATATPE